MNSDAAKMLTKEENMTSDGPPRLVAVASNTKVGADGCVLAVLELMGRPPGSEEGK